MRRTSGRSVGTLLRFDTHFIPEIYTCYPSLSQYFLFHQLFYQFLRLSTSSLLHFYSKVQNMYLLSLNFLNTSSFTNSSTSSYASLPPRFYTFTPKCKICTCSPSLSQYFLFHQLFYQFLRLSTSSLLHFYSKVQNVFIQLFSGAEIKLRYIKRAKYMVCKIVSSFDFLSICNIMHVNMLEVVEVTGRNKRCLHLTAGENSLYSHAVSQLCQERSELVCSTTALNI